MGFVDFFNNGGKDRMKKFLMLLLIMGLTLGLLTACGEPQGSPGDGGMEEVEEIEEVGEIQEEEVEEIQEEIEENERVDEAEEMEGSQPDTEYPMPQVEQRGPSDLNYVIEIDIEGYGIITVALDGTYAPETVANFANLVDAEFYDGLTFHRIIEGFMMQGGCPIGNGTGGSGDHIVGEFIDNGIYNPGRHYRGAISMARAQYYNSASSQFFIVHEDAFFLDSGYAVFGHVLTGMEVVDEIVLSAQVIDGNGTVLPENQPVINSIRIIKR